MKKNVDHEIIHLKKPATIFLDDDGAVLFRYLKSFQIDPKYL